MSKNKTLYDDLLQSLKEAKAISKGDARASRRFQVAEPDAKTVREQIGLSQSEFARLMRVSVKTLQNWEQHRRSPTGPAAALLKIVSVAPKVALKSLHV
jgi:putative transcriptional regulator